MKKIETVSSSIIALFFVSLSFLIFSFVYSSVKKKSLRDITEEKVSFEKSKADFSNLIHKMQDWENVEKEYNSFKNKMVLRFEDFSSFRENLILLINMNSLTKNKFRIEYQKVLHNEYLKVKMDILLDGSYRNLKKFIYDINRIEKIVCFRSITLSGTGSNIKGNFKMEVYLVR